MLPISRTSGLKLLATVTSRETKRKTSSIVIPGSMVQRNEMGPMHTFDDDMFTAHLCRDITPGHTFRCTLSANLTMCAHPGTPMHLQPWIQCLVGEHGVRVK